MVSSPEKGARLDVFLAEKTGLTRSRIGRLIGSGCVLVRGLKALKAGQRLTEGESVSLQMPKEDGSAVMPEDIPLDVLYHDGHIAVINKPPGMVVHPAAGHARGTLVNALIYRFGAMADVPGHPLRPGIVHRLDKDTSGAMVVALDADSYYALVDSFKKRAVRKEYIAVLSGRLKAKKGIISAGIGRCRTDRKKMSTRTRRPKEAVTEWEVVEELGAAAIVRARIHTGRTHQIRVHFSSAGNPVAGDSTYGKKTSLCGIKIPRQMLHSQRLSFTHPISGRDLSFEAPMPDDMSEVVERLRRLKGGGEPAG